MQTTRKGLIYGPTTKFVFHQMGPLVTGRRKHLRGKCDTNFIQYSLDKKCRREDTPVLYRVRFSKTTTEAREAPSKRRCNLRGRKSPLDHLKSFSLSTTEGGQVQTCLRHHPPVQTLRMHTCYLFTVDTQPAGNEVTSPTRYRNVRFFLSPLPRTASESVRWQISMRSTQRKVV